MSEEMSLWWASLILFAVPAGGFAVIGRLVRAWACVRFGVGFGLGLALIPVWMVPLTGVLEEWRGPVVLFVGVPVILLSMVAGILLACLIGVLFCGRKQWDRDGHEEREEKAKEQSTDG